MRRGSFPAAAVALLRFIAVLDNLKLEGGQVVGVSIVKRALEEPIRQIVVKSGVKSAVIVQEVKKPARARVRTAGLDGHDSRRPEASCQGFAWRGGVA